MALGLDELKKLAESDPIVAEIMASSLGARQVYFDSLRAMGRIPSVMITTTNSYQEMTFISDPNHVQLAQGGAYVTSPESSSTSK